MATDRPDVTEASSTVGAGVLQLETGYTYVRDRSDIKVSQSHSFPETLFRYGTPIDWLAFGSPRTPLKRFHRLVHPRELKTFMSGQNLD